MPLDTRPLLTTCHASISVETTTAWVFPAGDINCNSVPSAVYSTGSVRIHIMCVLFIFLTLCVFKCARKSAPQSFAVSCIRAQFWANRARSTTRAGVRSSESFLPLYRLTRASFDGRPPSTSSESKFDMSPSVRKRLFFAHANSSMG